MDGKEKAREVAEKLREETAEKEEKALEQRSNAIAALKGNTKLAEMYNANARIGADNLGGELPLLKVHATGRSRNELKDGSQPDDGAFFYKPQAEQFKEVYCHVLTISEGFRAMDMDNKNEKFNQILGGMIINDGAMKPFLMYFTGLKLRNLWDFGKAAGKYTHAKPISVPMFALTVKLTTEQVKTENYGFSWIVDFEIVKDENGDPELVLDEEEFEFLRTSALEMESNIKRLVDSKSSQEEAVPVQ